MNNLQNIAATFFIICVAVLTAVSILGVWEMFGADVIWKSFQTLGLVAVVSIVIIVAGRFVGNPAAVPVVPVPHPTFKAIRNLTLTTLIISSVLLAFLGVLVIWEVIAAQEVAYKSLSSLAILAFSSLIIVMMCLEREGSDLWKRHSRQLSGGSILLLILVLWIIFATIL